MAGVLYDAGMADNFDVGRVFVDVPDDFDEGVVTVEDFFVLLGKPPISSMGQEPRSVELVGVFGDNAFNRDAEYLVWFWEVSWVRISGVDSARVVERVLGSQDLGVLG
ncbi:hypothetical protein V5O48_003888 [Marasmius crinis-equi]|uniref:Uncharacterized protein n=1 Tax=Marasmius crinis-equi TaxID=585013 RepID=A0ABR3FRM7_9AGAR